ncbi:hypothetical protein AVEN_231640-1 [Araneus ventricosus]|uniref:Uncharacterized protein n=1 Tax=Araneus ventricosus TaxID=182803 RepID=A0A4Y2K1L2_ARAVE|nr:hypothetical protein AVEN_231640-1 [Araneus ventricosus]
MSFFPSESLGVRASFFFLQKEERKSRLLPTVSVVLKDISDGKRSKRFQIGVIPQAKRDELRQPVRQGFGIVEVTPDWFEFSLLTVFRHYRVHL